MSIFVPRDYQVEDLSKLIQLPRKGLFHEPGGGKTFIAAMFTQYVVNSTGEGVVWTQPGGIMAKNYRDILFATNLDPSEVVMVQGTAEKRKQLINTPGAKVLLMSGQGFSNEHDLLPKHFRHIVCDEIHLYYTLHNSARTQNWYRGTRKMGAIIPMTGTVIRGRLDSAYPILHKLAPQYYGNDRAFVQHHAWFDENGKVCGWKNHERLQEVLNRVGIFRSFKSIYGQEQKVIQIECLTVSDKTMKVYKQYEEMGLLEMEDEFIDSGQVGTNAATARGVLASPGTYGIKEVTAKEEYLRVLLGDHEKSGERLAIFSPQMKEQERIEEIMKEMGLRYGRINGTVSNAKRQEVDAKFQTGEIQFVLASPATAGIGFNWNFLETMLFMSLDYMDDSFVQAYRRGIRGVRETPLRIIILHYLGTIEDRVLQAVDRKSADFNKINPDVEPTRLFQLAYASSKK
jgi:superfamily II DNA or RNA helicase